MANPAVTRRMAALRPMSIPTSHAVREIVPVGTAMATRTPVRDEVPVTVPADPQLEATGFGRVSRHESASATAAPSTASGTTSAPRVVATR